MLGLEELALGAELGDFEAGGGTDADDGEEVGMVGGKLLASCFFLSSQLLTNAPSNTSSARRRQQKWPEKDEKGMVVSRSGADFGDTDRCV